MFARTHLTRHPAFLHDHIDFSARKALSAMTCCEVATSLETFADRDNNTYSLRFSNLETSRAVEICHTTRVRELIDKQNMGAEEPRDCSSMAGARSAVVPPGSQLELFLGAFDEQGPHSEGEWTSAYVFVRPCTSDHPYGPFSCELDEAAVSEHSGPFGYQVVRERDEEAGQWRPPHTVQICNSVTDEPQSHEDLLTGGMALKDLSVVPLEAGTAARTADFGMAVIDITAGNWRTRTSGTDLSGPRAPSDSFVDGRIAAYWRGTRNVIPALGKAQRNAKYVPPDAEEDANQVQQQDQNDPSRQPNRDQTEPYEQPQQAPYEQPQQAPYEQPGQEPDEQPEQDQDETTEPRTKLYRQLEWIVQVDSTKDDLSNLGDNLKRKDPYRLFRQLDPDQHYATYGDDSVTTLATDTQGAFFGAVNYGPSSALWGNFHTDFRGTEFAQFNRSLYGLRAEHKSEGQTPYGDPNVHFRIFASEAQTASSHAEFRATGGSLYYLRHTDVVMGSEKVWVEVRRRDSLQLEERRALVAGRDYEIDALQGRILLRAPLHQVMTNRFNNVINSRPLDGDDVYLLVDYEYVPSDFAAEDLIYGARFRFAMTPFSKTSTFPVATSKLNQLALGATYVVDEQGAGDQSLAGLDVTFRYGRNSYLSAEFATSDSASVFSNQASFDGGLTFDDANMAVMQPDGDALGAEVLIDLSDFSKDQKGTLRGWWKERQAGFHSANFAMGPEVTDAGFDLSASLGEQWNVNATVGETKRYGGRSQIARVQSSHTTPCEDFASGCWQLDVEGRHEDHQGANDPFSWSSDRNGHTNLIGARVAKRQSENTTIYAKAQAGEDESDRYDGGSMASVGANVTLNDTFALSGELSKGDRGDALIAGVDYSPGAKSAFNISTGVGSGATTQFTSRYTLIEGHELYGTYTLDPDRTDGDQNRLTLGQRSNAGNRTRVFTESQFAHNDRKAATGHTVGVELDATRRWVVSGMVQQSEVEHSDNLYERSAWSLGAVYSGEDIKVSTRAELRNDDSHANSTKQYVTSNLLRWRFDDDRRMLAKLNAALVDDDTVNDDIGKFVEMDLTYAHRSSRTSRFDFISRYAYLYDVGTDGQRDSAGDERSQILSAEGIYEFGGITDKTPKKIKQRWFSLGARIAARKGSQRSEKGRGSWHDVELGMASIRGTFKLGKERSTDFCEAQTAESDPDDCPGIHYSPWEVVLEYRMLRDFNRRQTSSGALIGLFKTLDSRHRNSKRPDTIRIGGGYNFSGFDDDLRRSSQKSDGWFVDVMAVF